MLEGDCSELQEVVKESLLDTSYAVRRALAAVPSQLLGTSTSTLKVYDLDSGHDFFCWVKSDL